jgi:hypothetical protein
MLLALRAEDGRWTLILAQFVSGANGGVGAAGGRRGTPSAKNQCNDAQQFGG